MQLDLDDAEREALVRLLLNTVKGDRFPFSPRIKLLAAILTRLADELEPKPAPYPPPKPPGEPSLALRKKRRRS